VVAGTQRRCNLHALHAQERLELQRQAEVEFAAERALVDEVVARIQQEDRMELAARRAKQADTKVGGEHRLHLRAAECCNMLCTRMLLRTLARRRT
jgi:hypothetical protein